MKMEDIQITDFEYTKIFYSALCYQLTKMWENCSVCDTVRKLFTAWSVDRRDGCRSSRRWEYPLNIRAGRATYCQPSATTTLRNATTSYGSWDKQKTRNFKPSSQFANDVQYIRVYTEKATSCNMIALKSNHVVCYPMSIAECVQ